MEERKKTAISLINIIRTLIFFVSFLCASVPSHGGKHLRRDFHNSRSHNRGGFGAKREDGKFPSRPPACVSSCVHRDCL